MSLFFHFYVAIRNRNVSLTAMYSIWFRITKPLHSIEADGCVMCLVRLFHTPAEEEWYKSTRAECTYYCVRVFGDAGTLERAYFSTEATKNTRADANWHFYFLFIANSRCLSMFDECVPQVFVNLLKFAWPNYGKISLCYTKIGEDDEEVGAPAAVLYFVLVGATKKVVAPVLNTSKLAQF